MDADMFGMNDSACNCQGMLAILSLETGSYQFVSWFLPVVSAALLLELTTLDSKMHPTANRNNYMYIKLSSKMKQCIYPHYEPCFYLQKTSCYIERLLDVKRFYSSVEMSLYQLTYPYIISVWDGCCKCYRDMYIKKTAAIFRKIFYLSKEVGWSTN